MLKILKSNLLVIGIILAFIIGITIPMSVNSARTITSIGNIGVAGVFLAYGLRIRTIEVFHGLRDIKLQGAILLITFIFLPLLGLTLFYLLGHFLTSPFLLGLLYLTLLPSTVQSSVSFVSIAGGDVARAVCAATISNILGIFITPLLVIIFIGAGGITSDGFTKVLYQLLLPFFIGQLFQPVTGAFFRKHKWITKTVDLSSIITVVLGAVVTATQAGVWKKVSGAEIILITTLITVILFLTFAFTIALSRILKQPESSKIVMLMCGSMKSLATGLPMANAFFPAATVAPLIVPVILYHQIQLFICSIIANYLGKATKNS